MASTAFPALPPPSATPALPFSQPLAGATPAPQGTPEGAPAGLCAAGRGQPELLGAHQDAWRFTVHAAGPSPRQLEVLPAQAAPQEDRS